MNSNIKAKYFLIKGKLERVIILILSVFATILIFSSSAAADGVGNGLEICADVLVPALFPFMVLADFMVKSGTAELLSRIISPFTRILFGKCRQAGSVFIMSVLGGYPIGARAARTLFEQGKISADQAAGIICFCVNSGPAFLVTAIGTVLFGSVKAGLVLLLSNTAASVLTGALFMRLPIKAKNPFSQKPYKRNSPKKASLIDTFVESVAVSCSSMFAICGFVALFCCFTAVLRTMPLPSQVSLYLQPIMEISAGCIELARNNAHLTIISAAIAFGGFCVHFQTLSIAKGLAPKYIIFFTSRVIHASLAGAITFALKDFYEPVVYAISMDGTRRIELFSSHPVAIAALFSTSVFLLFDLKKTKSEFENKNLKRDNPFETFNKIFKTKP